MFGDNCIFQPNIFRSYLEEKTNIDGSDVGSKLTELFQILNTKTEDYIMSELNSFNNEQT